MALPFVGAEVWIPHAVLVFERARVVAAGEKEVTVVVLASGEVRKIGLFCSPAARPPGILCGASESLNMTPRAIFQRY